MGMGMCLGSTTATFRTRHHLWAKTIQCFSHHTTWAVCLLWLKCQKSGGSKRARKELTERKDHCVYWNSAGVDDWPCTSWGFVVCETDASQNLKQYIKNLDDVVAA